MTTLRRAWPAVLIFVVLWLGFLAAGRTRLMLDPGSFWHTVAGERLLAEGFFQNDLFTFTHSGSHWIPQQWLGEMLMASLHREAGFGGLLYLTATLLATLYTYLALRLVRTGLHPVVVSLLVLLFIAASAHQFHIRPLMVTMFGIVIVTRLLMMVELDGRSVRRLWWFVPVFLVWQNIHGGVIAGWAMLVLAAVGWQFARAMSWPNPVRTRRSVVVLWSLIVSLVLFVVVNPYGLELPRTWFSIVGAEKIAIVIEEHERLNPAKPMTWPGIMVMLGYCLLLCGLPRREWRVVWLLPLPWMIESVLHVRNLSLCSLTILTLLPELWSRTCYATWLERTRPDFIVKHARTWRVPMVAWFVCGLLVAVGWMLHLRQITVPIVGANWLKLDPTRWPVDLLPLLREHEPRAGQPSAILNECEFGGYLVYHVPGYRTFFDDRVELFGVDWMLEYLEESRTNPKQAIAKWEAQYGRFAFALVRPDTPLSVALQQSSGWVELGRDSAAVFFKRIPDSTNLHEQKRGF